MSNNYYAGNVIYNNQHKELTIQGNLSAQQMMKIAKDFFAEEDGGELRGRGDWKS